jgi:hypothetical protein
MEVVAPFKPELPIVVCNQPWMEGPCRIADWSDVGWTDALRVMALYEGKPHGGRCGCHIDRYVTPERASTDYARQQSEGERVYALILESDNHQDPQCWPAHDSEGEIDEDNLHGKGPRNRVERRAQRRRQGGTDKGGRGGKGLTAVIEEHPQEVHAIGDSGEDQDDRPATAQILLGILAVFPPETQVIVPRQPWLAHPKRLNGPGDVGWTDEMMVTALYQGAPEGPGESDCGCGIHSYRSPWQMKREGTSQIPGHVYGLLVESDEYRNGMVRSWPYYDASLNLDLSSVHQERPVPYILHCGAQLISGRYTYECVRPRGHVGQHRVGGKPTSVEPPE